jgi:hypothetical protein
MAGARSRADAPVASVFARPDLLVAKFPTISEGDASIASHLFTALPPVAVAVTRGVSAVWSLGTMWLAACVGPQRRDRRGGC